MSRYLQEKFDSRDINPVDTFISLESEKWRRPKRISLENIAGLLQVKVSEDKEECSVYGLKIENQEIEPLNPPGEILQKTYISVDKNYLYVWVENKWKRIPLMDW